MAHLPYSALDSVQRSLVAYLFADQFFGVDAGGFEYEVIGGAVVGRMTKDEGRKTYQRGCDRVVVMTQEDTGIDTQVNLYMNADRLVAILIDTQTILEEVKP